MTMILLEITENGGLFLSICDLKDNIKSSQIGTALKARHPVLGAAPQ